MPWSGTGTFSRKSTSVSPPTSGSTISSADMDTYTADVTSGINSCIAKNGENAMTGDLNMGSQQVSSMADGTARTDAASVGQIQDGDNVYIPDTGSANAYEMTLVPPITTYVTGMGFRFKAANANTGASTLDINSVAATNIKTFSGADPAAGTIAAGGVYTVIYDGTNFVLQTENYTGADTSIVTGTAGTSGYVAQWNGDGDLVDGKALPSGEIVGDTDVGTSIVDKAAGATTFTSDTTLATVGLLKSNIATGTYVYDAHVTLNDCGNGGVKCALAFTNGTDLGSSMVITLDDGTVVGDASASLTYSVAAGSLTASTYGVARVTGMISISNATNSVDLQFAQAASNADTLTIAAASWIRLTKQA